MTTTNKMTSFEQLRYMGDGAGSVYEYCAERRAWILIGKLNGATLADWLTDYQNVSAGYRSFLLDYATEMEVQS